MKRWHYSVSNTLMLATLFVVLPCAGQELRTAILRIAPSTTAQGCEMLSAHDASVIQTYGSIAVSPAFQFTDPVPADAVLWNIRVSPSLLGSCLPSKEVVGKLNPATPGTFPEDVLLGTIRPVDVITSCTQHAHFRETAFPARTLVAPRVESYIRGGINTIELSDVGSGCDSFVEYVDVEIDYYVDLPRVIFDATGATEAERQVLAAIWRSDDTAIPSPYQAAVPVDLRNQSFILSGQLLSSSGAPLPFTEMYLRAVDPPNGAPYVPVSERGYDDDKRQVTLRLADGTYVQYNNVTEQWWRVVTDAGGRFRAIATAALAGWWRVGGNLHFEGSALPLPYPRLYTWHDGVEWRTLNSAPRCEALIGCYPSPEFSVRRRVYVEVDRMFRQGSFLRSSVAAGATELPVENDIGFANASPTSPVAAIVVNLPAAPESRPYPAHESYAEPIDVIGVAGNRRDRRLVLKTPLARSYTARLYPPDTRMRIGAAVGVYRSPDDLFPADSNLARNLFTEISTDYVALNDVQNHQPFVPHVADCSGSNRTYCQELYLHTFNSIELPENGGFTRTARYNHHQLVGARRGAVGVLGETLMRNSVTTYDYHTMAVIYQGTIEAATADAQNVDVGGLLPEVVNRETVAHELVHTHNANPPAFVDPPGGHCTANAWDGGSCLMNTSRTKQERGDDRVSLHNAPYAGSEFWQILRRNEPLPEFASDTVEPRP